MLSTLQRILRAEQQDETLCVFCHDRVRTRLFHPCMHVCTCEECTDRISKCPLCKTSIVDMRKVHLS